MNEPYVVNGREKVAALIQNLEDIIYGKREAVEVMVTALLSGGSALIEDVPGVGKTTLAKALAKSIDAEFRRVQFTPDLLPGDILGSSIYNPVDGSFTFRPGPIFCNILLADEINRASPRTQSALLEAMSEGQVSIEGQRHPLHAPFMVMATQNPVEFQGTYPLPEAQLDRFMVWLHLGYPAPDVETGILEAQVESHPLEQLQAVVTRDEIVALQQQVRRIRVEQTLSRYIVDIVNHSRQDSRLKLGVSPRGSLMLFRAAQAVAFANGREYVLPDDIQHMAPYVLPHRVVLTSKAEYSGVTKGRVVEDILTEVRVPT